MKKSGVFRLEWENGEEKFRFGREKGGDGVEGVWGKLWKQSVNDCQRVINNEFWFC